MSHADGRTTTPASGSHAGPTSTGAGALAWALFGAVIGCVAAVVWLLSRRSGIPGAPAVGLSTAVVTVVFTLSTATTGALVARRRPRHPIGWLLLVSALGYAVGSVAVAYVELAVAPDQQMPVGPAAVWLGNTAFGLGVGLSATYVLLLFPTGRLPSPRWRPVAWTSGGALVSLLIAVNLGPHTFAGLPFDNPVASGGWNPAMALERGASALLGVMSVCSAASLIVRYLAACGIERRQLKWVAYAAAIAGAMLVGVAVAMNVLGSVALDGDAENLVVTIAVSLIPVAIGIAILRHQLFDIDRIISRTIAYAAVTTLLVGLYAAIAVLPTTLFDVRSDLLVAVATLAAAAVFGPVRRRVQTAVDRRFNRTRYDAARTIDAFGGRLRSQLGIAALVGDVTAVVASTMQPMSVSIWLAVSEAPSAERAP